MKKILAILFLITKIALADTSTNVLQVNTQKCKNLLIEERNLEALQLATSNLNSVKAEGKQELILDNLVLITDALFQLKQYTALLEVISEVKPFLKKRNSAAYQQIIAIECKYWNEIGWYEKTISCLKNEAPKTKDKTLKNAIILILADALFRNDYLEASKIKYESLLLESKDVLQRSEALNGIGCYYNLKSKYDSAMLFYQEALKGYQETVGTEHTKWARVMYNIALVKGKIGAYEDAKKIIQQVLKIYIKKYGEIHPRVAESYAALGGFYMNEDNLDKSILYFLKDQSILEKLYGNQHPELVYSYLDLGTVYNEMGEYAKAEVFLNKALFLVKKNWKNNKTLTTTISLELASTFIAQHKLEIAKIVLENSLKYADNITDKADLELKLGELYLKQKQYKIATNYFKESYKIYQEVYGDKNSYSIEVLLQLSEANLQDQKTTDAIQFAQLALNQTTQKNAILFPYDHWECQLKLIECEKTLFSENKNNIHDITKEINQIKQTLNEANTIKQTYHTNGSKMHYAEKMTLLNELGIYFLTHFYPKKDAFFVDNLLFFAENNKANLLKNKINEALSSEILPAQEQAISASIINKLNYFISLNENQEKVAFKINDSILLYQNKYENFTKQIEQKYPKIYDLKYGDKPLNSRQIQLHLKSDESFIVYCNDAENYYCITLSKHHIIYKNCGNKKTIDSLIIKIQQTILDKKFIQKNALFLSGFLLPKHLEKNIILVPDAQLSSISFDVLPIKNQLLVYLHPLQYAFSINAYFKPIKQVSEKNILAFYPDFSNTKYAALNTQREHEILSTFSNYQCCYKNYATKAQFLQRCNKNGVLHFATHLSVDSISPLQSAIVFQPNSANYLLRINEIWKLNINAQMVVLAGCKGNFGKNQMGEGIQNFAWAFNYAGVHSILSTQWNASDKSTAILLNYFYKNLKAGKSQREALQNAKIKYLESTDAFGAQPFFWANYILLGDKTSVNIAPSLFSKFWWIPLGILILVFFILLTYRKVYPKIKSYT